VPGAAAAVQAFGDFQNFNPHLDIMVTNLFFLDMEMVAKIMIFLYLGVFVRKTGCCA